MIIKIIKNNKVGQEIKRIKIPETWAEIAENKRISLVRQLLTISETTTKLLFLQDILGKEIYHNCTREDIIAMTKALAFLSLSQDNTTPIIDKFRHKKVWYHLPRAECANLRCGEWLAACTYLDMYLATKDANHLIGIVATLAREANKNKQEQILLSDIRIKHVTGDLIEYRIQKLHGLDPAIVSIVLHYFESTRKLIYQIIVENELAENSDKKEKQDWRSLFMSIATHESPWKGGFDELMEVYLLDVLKFLIIQKQSSNAFREGNK